MNIEEKIFKNYVVKEDKLEDYGFINDKDKYIYSENILDNTFKVEITIKNNKVSGKIYDLSFDDEYTNFRGENVGKFVNKVKEEFENILIDIRNKCFTKKDFLFDQSNRISKLIYLKYKDQPQFLWKSSPFFGVFRNNKNNKWYGIIMNINESKLRKGNNLIEIINVKLNQNLIKELLKKDGFYKAYHMNKDNWISIVLDDTIKDEEIMSLIDKSYSFTDILNTWLVPSNPKYYDIINCFNEKNEILWKQSNNIFNGDIVYIYVGSPYSAIFYKCKVIEVDIPYNYEDNNIVIKKAMRIKLLKKYDKNKFTFNVLKQYGVNAIRGPRSIPEKLIKKLES